MEQDKILYKKFLEGDNEEVILYILENKEKYNSSYSLKTYLYTIAKSKAINYLKKEERNIQLEDNYISKDNIEEAICSNEKIEKIHNIIRKMAVDYQIVIHAGYTIYQKVWKTPEKYNLKEENEVTKEDKEKSLTKEEAIIKAKEITESLEKHLVM